MSMRLASLLLAAFTGAQAQAQGLSVRLQNLELQYRFVSISLPWATVGHEYRSRTLYVNGLGLGWCDRLEVPGGKDFDLDVGLLIEPGRILLRACGSPQTFGFEGRYVPGPEDRVRLRERSLKDAVRQGETFTLRAPGLPPVMSLGADDIRLLHDSLPGGVIRFGWDGRLRAIGDIEIVNDSQGRRSALKNPVNGETLDFQYAGKRLVRIGNAVGQARFAYTPDGVLEQVENGWQKTYAFTFSEHYNLQSITFPDKTQYLMFYDEDKDVITNLINRNGCTESYSSAAGENRLSYKIQSALSCEGKVKRERTVTYRFGENGRLLDMDDRVLDDKGQRIRTEDALIFQLMGRP